MSRRWQRTAIRAWIAAIAALMGVVGPGCGTDEFVPPPPPGPREAARPTPGTPAAAQDPFVTGSTVRNIEVIIARGTAADDAEAERAAARSQAGFDKARVRILPDEEPGGAEGGRSKSSGPHQDESQAEMLRRSVARKPQAIIVEPEDPADEALGRAILEAREARIPVVVLGRTPGLTGTSAGASPLVSVRPEPFAASARKLVELSIRNARTAKLDPQGGAILLITQEGDRLLGERVAAVRAALKDAKIATVDEMSVRKDITSGVNALRKRLQEDRRPTLVFFFDVASGTVSNTLAGEIVQDRPFIQAGYTSDTSLPRMTLAGEFAAVAEFQPYRLIQRAIGAAVGLAQGRSVKEVDELPIPVVESRPTAGAPRWQAAQFKSRNERAKQAE